MSSQTTDNTIVRASELGEYVYCARAWWLRHEQGVASRNLAALQSGSAAHDRHGRDVASAVTQRRLAFLLALVGVAVAIVAMVLAAGGAL
jgi:CRISPR/Cas system-associated exonuclease Cas4 (RecB family)